MTREHYERRVHDYRSGYWRGFKDGKKAQDTVDWVRLFLMVTLASFVGVVFAVIYFNT